MLQQFPSDQPDPEDVKKESDSVKQEDDQTDGDVAVTDQVSQVATAGSMMGDVELAADPLQTQRRNNLARYTIGNLGLDSFVDIFNVLSAVASRYVDSEGTFVRKLSLSEQPPHMRELLGGYDPVIVFVDSEIEEAIRTMAGDLSALSQRYPSQHGIDWITFQYHLSLMQQDAPRGWNAPGFRLGGRIPMSVGNLCQNHMTHDEFTHCHATPIRDWQRVKHMATLRRDPAMRENYVHAAVGALAHYNKIAREANPQLEEMVMDDMLMIEYDQWSSQLNTLADAIRTGTGVAAIPDSRMEARERQARVAEADLIQSIEDENEARARRTQKKKEKKERRSHSSTQPSHHTVILLDYHPPQEPSDEEGESVTRRLDFDEGSRALSVREPDTPEELHQQPNQPSSPSKMELIKPPGGDMPKNVGTPDWNVHVRSEVSTVFSYEPFRKWTSVTVEQTQEQRRIDRDGVARILKSTEHSLFGHMAMLTTQMGANLRAYHFLRNQEFLGMKPVKKITLLQVKELIDQIVEWKWVNPAPISSYSKYLPSAGGDMAAILNDFRGRKRLKVLWDVTGYEVAKASWSRPRTKEEYFKTLAVFWSMNAPVMLPSYDCQALDQIQQILEGSHSQSKCGKRMIERVAVILQCQRRNLQNH